MSKTELAKKSKEELIDLVLLKTKEVEDAVATIDDMQATIEALNESKEQASKGIVVIKHDKKDYQLMVPKFNFAGQRGITQKELEAQPALIDKILELEGQQILQPFKK